MNHLLFIVARVENLRHDVELMVVVLSGLGQLRSDIEFLVLMILCEPNFLSRACQWLLRNILVR
jgi:hypothetical protein